MNRIDPALFSACFEAWVAERWPQVSSLVALDGKTSRRSHDQATGRRALHLVSAFATNRHLVLGQEAVEEKSNEIVAIPALLARLALEGALVTIDAMGCNPAIAQSILDAKADYLLAVKDNQPTLHAEIKSYFQTAPSLEVEQIETAALRFAPIRSPMSSTGTPRSAPIRAHPVSPNSPPSPWSRAASSAATRSRPNSDPISPPGRSRPQPSLTAHAAIGGSKTTFIGRST